MEHGFVWGAASAAFQMEGASREDGKGLSIWDVMLHEPGRAKRGDTGDVACDHYHRWREDVRLMAELGIGAYRFSIAWSRVLPEGTGKVNEAGIAFYSNLVDALLENGIQPYVTLYHWDLPEALFLRGGWMNPESPEWFYRYAKLVGERLGGRVKHFITLNEPNNTIEGLTPGGANAPGLGYPLRDRLAALHNHLKAHGRAVQALRETVPDAQIGFAPCCAVPCPADDRPETVRAAKDLFFSSQAGNLTRDFPVVTLYSDPVFLGDYPREYYDFYARDLRPEITKEDLRIISEPTDVCFHNIYSGEIVRTDEQGAAAVVPWTGPRNMLGWPVIPQTLYWGPKCLWERYGKPIMITENGYPATDCMSLDGAVHDPGRIDFIRRYTGELARARRDGADIRGYFYWCIMDNLEWELGFEPRFGLIHVDFDTLVRTPKDSYAFYRELVKKPL